jgi:uncharacterized Zn finger protein
MYKTIGKCSLCGGNVVKHQGAWMGVIPPRAHCDKCGAVEDNAPVIKMKKPNSQRESNDPNKNLLLG